MRSCAPSASRPAASSDLNFHLLHTGLAPDHKADIDRIATEYGARLHYYDLNAIDVFKTLGEKGRFHKRLTHVIYARLLLDEILPPEVARVIYMDCDMYVRAPIEGLYDMDLEGFPIAAARDPYSFHIIGGRDLRANLDLFNLYEPYFNSGLIVIDRAAWTASGLMGKFEKMVADGTMDRLYYDQDVLNIVFCNNWKRLDALWNVLNPRGPHETFDPKLLHYTGPRKPWHLVSVVAFARAYRHVMTNELFYRYFWFRMRRRLRRWIGIK